MGLLIKSGDVEPRAFLKPLIFESNRTMGQASALILDLLLNSNNPLRIEIPSSFSLNTTCEASLQQAEIQVGLTCSVANHEVLLDGLD